jgi:hypothetical protein
MPSIRLPLHSYNLRSIPSSTSRLVNCFIEQLPPDANTPSILYRSAGITQAATVGTSVANYGLHAGLGKLFAVYGTNLYWIDSSNVATLVGSIGTPTQQSIDMDHNVDTVVVVNTPNAYYYTPSTATFGQISDADFTSRGAADVEFLDNWMLFREPSSGRVFGADVGTATSFSALNFFTAEGSPDDLVGMKADHRQLLLLGTETGELWENTGISGFPFERAINGFFELGCLNGRSIAKLDNSVFWLASDFTVRRLNGITPVRVSTHAIEQRLHDMTISTAKASVRSYEGHLFYKLSFDEGTFVYDAATGLWHEEKSYGYDGSIWINSALAYDRYYVGNRIDTRLGIIDAAVYAEASSIQIAEWTYQPIYTESERAFHHRLEVIVETGVGGAVAVVDPQIMLEYSDDSGRTWTSLPQRSLGRMGEYRHPVVWNRLGSAAKGKARVYKMSVSDAVKVNVTDTLLEVTGGRL